MLPALGLLTTLIQLAVVIGVVVFIVRSVGRKGTSTTESSGIFIRRFFQYLAMLVMLALAVAGVIGLIDSAAAAATSATQDTTGTARSIAFVLVALPVYAGLAIYTKRCLDTDAQEERSFGWSFYLTAALVGSLVTTMSLSIAFIGDLLDTGDADRSRFIPALVWGAVWAAHWYVAQRRAAADRMQIHLLLGSAAALVASAIGAAVFLTALGNEFYEAATSLTVVEDGLDALVGGLVALAVGALVWWWYWLRHARRTARTPWWLGYVLLVGVLGGVITAATGAGVIVFGILWWLLTDVSDSAAVHFEFLPAAAATVAVGAAVWAYHGIVLGDRETRERTELDRVYDYVLSAVGLLLTAGGVATLISAVIDALGGQEVVSDWGGEVTASALALLVIGVPLSWRYWRAIRRAREAEPAAETGSVTRRIYLFSIIGVGGLVAAIDLIIVVYVVFENLLESTFDAGTISALAIPMGLLLTAGMAAWYHLAVFREDRALVPEPSVETRPALREVIVVGDDRLVTGITAGTRASVRALRVVDPPTTAATLDELLAALEAETHHQVVVVAESDHYELLPITN